MPSFDLLTEPWIPVLDTSTDLREVGLREALLCAHEIREVYTDSPLETIAINRLLLALALDVYQRRSDEDVWIALWKAGQFPVEPLDTYLSDPTLGLDRFDLLHPEHPFYQRAEPDDSQEGKEPAPLAKLFHAQASGNNATLFGHNMDSQPERLPLSHAARGLVAIQAAALGGGVAKPFNFSHGPLVGRAQFWIRGRSLFEALLLNGPPEREARMHATEKDAPVWRRDPPKVYERRRHYGLLDMLTCPSRRLTLVAEEDEGETVATGVYFTQGDKLDPQPTDDPLAAHVASKDKGLFPLGLRSDRALWRDASVLFNVLDPEGEGAPRTFGWVSTFTSNLDPDDARRLRRTLREDGVDAFGLVNDQAKAELWRHERLPLHLPILHDTGRQQRVKEALDHADQQFSDPKKGLRRALRVTAEYALAPPAPGDDAYPNADPKAASALAQSLGAEPRYWALLESAFFAFLARLADAGDNAQQLDAVASWQCTTFLAAERAFAAATVSFDRDARHLRARAEGRARLQPVVPLPEECRPYGVATSLAA
jgi:CRISPR system Cascade subunit CasA